MGEQFIDLFTASAYALVGRMYVALSSASMSWVFFTLASAGLLFALIESAVDQRPEFWLRHLFVVGLASVLTLMPQRIDLAPLTYGAPGKIEQFFGTQTGAAPHLTYWIERFGATAAAQMQSLTQHPKSFVVPGVAAQVDEIASDPASVNDPQLRANLEIWRRRLLPQILLQHPDLAQQIGDARLSGVLLDPTPAASQFVGAEAAQRAQAVQAALASANIDLPALLRAQAPMLNEITANAGAANWVIPNTPGTPASIRFGQRSAATISSRSDSSSYGDALQRGATLAADLQAQLPQAGNQVDVTGVDQLYDLLGRSVLYNAGVTITRDPAMQGILGSLCQRAGDDACRSAMSPLVAASSELRVPEPDAYNTFGVRTLIEQPIASILLSVTALILRTLSMLVVSVLPFALGIAKALAIVISTIGVWMLLWPGRVRVALTWMLGPISFVSLWSVFFNLWSDIEISLSQIAAIVGGAEHGSWSARAAMSIAISLGYMGLPSLALGVVYGESGRALYHASARLETALMLAWHTRGAIAAFGRRWLVNSPLARRWNQRAYRAVGLGPLRPLRTAGSSGAGTRHSSSAPGAKSSRSGVPSVVVRTSKAPTPPQPGSAQANTSTQGKLFADDSGTSSSARKRAPSKKAETGDAKGRPAPTTKKGDED